ncbi:MAG: glycosyltransferase [Clostridia bacterium]|nr:glycosyltransferase [Clostridia bacterium]
MNNSPMFSIIIPVYNVENELARCIDSIINQTMHNFEVILVDDGSPDNCPQICDEYAEKYNYITVIHKENGGVSSARNAGIKIANGKYIWFIDSDDYIEPNSIEIISSFLKDNDYDFLEFNLKTALSGQVEDFNEFLMSYYFKCGITASPCDKIFKTSLIRDNNIEYDTDEKIGEDHIFNMCYYRVIKTFVFITDSLYHYVYRAGSAMNSGKGKRPTQWIRMYDKLMSKIGDSLSEEISCDLFITHLIVVLKHSKNSVLTEKERKEFVFQQFKQKRFSNDAWKKGMKLFFSHENASFLGKMRVKIFFGLNRRGIKIWLY